MTNYSCYNYIIYKLINIASHDKEYCLHMNHFTVVIEECQSLASI
jgi:hypothetical protein